MMKKKYDLSKPNIKLAVATAVFILSLAFNVVLAADPPASTPTEQPAKPNAESTSTEQPAKPNAESTSTEQPEKTNTGSTPTEQPEANLEPEPTEQPEANPEPETTEQPETNPEPTGPTLELDDPEQIDTPPLSDYGVNENNLDTMDDTEFNNIQPEAFGSFEPNNIEALPLEVFDNFEAQDIQNLQPDAVEAIEPEEFEQLPLDALRGFTEKNIDALDDDVLYTINAEKLAKMNPNAIKKSARPGRIFTELNAEQIPIDQIKDYLPDGWSVNEETGEISAPPNTKLTYKEFDSETAISPKKAAVPELADLSSSFSVGGKGGVSAQEQLSQGLQQATGLPDVDMTAFSIKQDKTGFIKVEGSGVYQDRAFNFLASTDSIEQVPSDEAAGLGTDEGGFPTIITPNKQRVTLAPAPDVANLVDALNVDEPIGIDDEEQKMSSDICTYKDQTVKLNQTGDVLMKIPDSTTRFARDTKKTDTHVVGIFDAFKESPPQQFCSSGNCNWVNMPSNLQVGVHFSKSNKKSRAKQTAYVVYPDGSTQTFYPTVLNPNKFQALLLKVNGMEKAVYQVDGSFKVIFNGNAMTLSPTFDTVVNPLEADAVVKPSVSLQQDGTLKYAVQDCTNLITSILVFE